MRTMNLFTVGLLSMLVATAAFVSDSLASYARVDVISTSTYSEKGAQLDSAQWAAAETIRVDVKDTDMKAEGPSYAYLKPMNH